MKVTEALKSWLRDNKAVSEDASDEDYSRAAADALMSGDLTRDKFVALTEEKEAKEANSLAAAIHGMSSVMEKMDERLRSLESSPKEETKEADPPKAKIAEDAPTLPGGNGADVKAAMSRAEEAVSTDPLKIRQITADQRYEKTRREMRYPERTDNGKRHGYAGQRVFERSEHGVKRYIDEPSELDQAVSGAWFKYSVHCSKPPQIPASLRMTDHDWELVQYALHNYKFGGEIGVGTSEPIYVDNKLLNDRGRKALLDDGGASGGLEAAPIVFDDALIQIPLLHGEFFPLVNLVTLSRGRRVEGVSALNVTLGTSTEGTAIPLFNTASFISAFDTTIHVVAGAIEIGLDFQADSPIDWAAVVQNQYSQQLLAWLDEQICVGDGTNEPDGIVASAATNLTSANGNTGPPTVGDYESLLFGVTKANKVGSTNRIVFGANETTYQRARAIAVGASDERRVFGMTHEDYMLLGHPYKINDNIANTAAFFGDLSQYRMYRRLGITSRVSTEGRTLVRANEMMISVRARFGGQIERGAAFAEITDMQS